MNWCPTIAFFSGLIGFSFFVLWLGRRRD